MAIYYNNHKITGVYKGTQEISKLYHGDRLIFSADTDGGQILLNSDFSEGLEHWNPSSPYYVSILTESQASSLGEEFVGALKLDSSSSTPGIVEQEFQETLPAGDYQIKLLWTKDKRDMGPGTGPSVNIQIYNGNQWIYQQSFVPETIRSFAEKTIDITLDQQATKIKLGRSLTDSGNAVYFKSIELYER